MSKPLTLADIKYLIPHREPMLLVSNVRGYEPDSWIETSHKFDIHCPFFTGHFPGQPILPGIVMVESMAQSAALLTSLTKNLNAEKAGYLFMAIEGVKFKTPLTPGKTLTMRVEKMYEKLNVLNFRGTAYVEGALACEATFTAKLILK